MRTRTPIKTSIAVVHIGIIENHEQIRQELSTDGCVFHSQTDSEVIPNLLAKIYNGDPLQAIREVIPQLEGSFLLPPFLKDHPQQIFVRVKVRPTYWQGDDQMLIASDVRPLAACARIYATGRWTACGLSRHDCAVYDFSGKQLSPDTKLSK